MTDQHPQMEIVCRTKAGKRLMSTNTGPTFTALVSIGDPVQRYPAGFNKVGKRIRLEFDDVVHTDRRREFYSGPEIYSPPTRDDVDRLIRFARTLEGKSGKVLVHCYAGVSRSTAAGFILHCVWLGPGNEEEAMNLTCKAAVNKGIDPNVLMIKFADELLDRGGRMEDMYYQFFVSSRGMY